MGRATARASRNRLLVLGYHNVESTWRWPAATGTGAATFARQLKVLRRSTNIVPLDESLKALREGRPLPPRAVAITFDDGYRDNLTHAVPLLKRYDLPATIFLVPGYLSGQVHAWWERLGWVIRKAAAGSVTYAGTRLPLDTPQERETALDAIEMQLKDLDHADRLAAVERLVDELEPGNGYHADELFLDWNGARDLVRAGISLGSHTMRHAILARETEQSQREDLRKSRELLQDDLRTPIDTLAYPNGQQVDYDATTLAAVEAAGYSNAVTTWGTPSSADTPPYEISRMMVSTDTPAARLALRVLKRLVQTPEQTPAEKSAV